MKQILIYFYSVYSGTIVEAKVSSVAVEAVGRQQAGGGSAAASGGTGGRQAAAVRRQAAAGRDQMCVSSLSMLIKDNEASFSQGAHSSTPKLWVGLFSNIKICFFNNVLVPSRATPLSDRVNVTKP